LCDFGFELRTCASCKGNSTNEKKEFLHIN
jgi:hypothetical protein